MIDCTAIERCQNEEVKPGCLFAQRLHGRMMMILQPMKSNGFVLLASRHCRDVMFGQTTLTSRLHSKTVARRLPRRPQVRESPILKAAFRFANQKGDASPEGLDQAIADVAQLKMKLRSMAPNELVAAFITTPPKPKYGEYEYYYGVMANMAIQKEIENRADGHYPRLEIANRERHSHRGSNQRSL